MISRRSFAKVIGQALVGSALALGMMPKQSNLVLEPKSLFVAKEGDRCLTHAPHDWIPYDFMDEYLISISQERTPCQPN